MARRIEAWMDGEALSSAGPFIIREVYEDPAALEILTGERPGGYGQRLLSKKRQSLSVAIEVMIRELFDLTARARHAEALAAWCRGSVLELSNRPERRLHCYCSAEPALGEVRNYTSALRVEFTADAVPYWEDVTPREATASGSSSGSGTLWIPGSAATPVCVTVTPTGGSLTSFSVTVGGQTIELENLSVAQNGTLSFLRDARDDLSIMYSGASQLPKRTAESADDLFTEPGSAAYSFTANTACTVTVSARGRWA